MAVEAQGGTGGHGGSPGGSGGAGGSPWWLEAPLQVHPTNPRYFADATGQAVYVNGFHTWSTSQEMGDADPPLGLDYDAYLDLLADGGHNFTRLWTWELTRCQYGDPLQGRGEQGAV